MTSLLAHAHSSPLLWNVFGVSSRKGFLRVHILNLTCHRRNTRSQSHSTAETIQSSVNQALDPETRAYVAKRVRKIEDRKSRLQTPYNTKPTTDPRIEWPRRVRMVRKPVASRNDLSYEDDTMDSERTEGDMSCCLERVVEEGEEIRVLR